jgi:hypothetical protein
MRGMWIGASDSDIVYGLSSAALDPVSLHLEPSIRGGSGRRDCGRVHPCSLCSPIPERAPPSILSNGASEHHGPSVASPRYSYIFTAVSRADTGLQA